MTPVCATYCDGFRSSGALKALKAFIHMYVRTSAPLPTILAAMPTHTSSWAVVRPVPFIAHNAKIVMATTPIQAHHMLGEEDVHIGTSISCWRHATVCWAGRVGGGGGGTGIAAHVHMYCMDVELQ